VSPGAGRRARVGAALVLAALLALRLATLAPDPWEWDEVFLADGVRHGIDVRLNRPHPPGYPLFVEAGRLLGALGLEPFTAATLVGTLGSFGAVLGTLLLGRELGLRPGSALLAATLYALIPAVWLHGVRPLTDGPAAGAFLLAAALLARSARTGSGPDLVAGAAVAAACAGLRPQIAVGLLPQLVTVASGSLRRPRGARSVALAALAGAAVTLAVWLPAVAGSGGLAAWLGRMGEHSDYWIQADVTRAALLREPDFWLRWLRDPFSSTALAGATLALAAAAFAVSLRRALAVGIVFLPVFAATILLCGRDPGPRYATAFLAAPCLLAAAALEALRSGRARRLVPAAAGLLLLGLGLEGAGPALEVHRRPSPPVAALRELREDSALRGRPVAFDESLMVHARELRSERETRVLAPDGLVAAGTGELMVVADRALPDARLLRRHAFADPRLRRISRGRLLAVSVYEAARR
jgi:hypothetical protein